MGKSLLAKGLLFSFLIVIFLIQPGNSTGDVVRYEISPRGKIKLILHELDNTINSPNQINIDRLKYVIPSENWDYFLAHIGFFQEKSDKYLKRFDFPVNHYSEFILDTLVSDYENDNNLAECRIVMYSNNYFEFYPVNIIFSTDYNPQILNIENLLTSINSCLDDFRSKGPGYITPTEYTPNEKYPNSNYSIHFLKPKILYSDKKTTIPRFTIIASEDEFDRQIIMSPHDILPIDVNDPPFTNFGYLMITDAGESRIIGGNSTSEGKFFLDGSWGSGEHQYNRPEGISYFNPNHFVIADTYNRRAVIYAEPFDDGHFINWHYKLDLINNNGAVADVASARFPDEEHAEIAVLDRDNCRVDIYLYEPSPLSAVFMRSICSKGSGDFQLDRPSSVCYSRDFSGNRLPVIYIADAGNRRVVRIPTDGSQVFFETEYAFPEDAYLSSVCVDYYGYVYVLDRYNSRLYIFTPGLSTLIASFGTRGEADGELYFPWTFKVAESYLFDAQSTSWITRNIGEAGLVEILGNNTGIRRFTLGFDILHTEPHFIPRYNHQGTDLFRFEWFQTGATNAIRRFYYGDFNTLLDSTYDAINLPGAMHYTYYNSGDSAQPGWYYFKVDINSIYGSNDTTLIDSVYVYEDYCGDQSDWVKIMDHIPTYPIEHGLNALITNTGNYVVTSNGTFDYSMRLLNGCGNIALDEDFNQYIHQEVSSSIIDRNANYILTGNSGDSTLYLARIDQMLNPIWTNKYDMGGDLSGHKAIETNDDGIIVTGLIVEAV